MLCILTVKKTDGSLSRPDLNLPVGEKGGDRNKLIKETAQDKLLEAWINELNERRKISG